MISKEIIERIISKYVYVYVKYVGREFGGVLKSIANEEIIIVEDKNNNLNYIPISQISVITERQ